MFRKPLSLLLKFWIALIIALTFAFPAYFVVLAHNNEINEAGYDFYQTGPMTITWGTGKNTRALKWCSRIGSCTDVSAGAWDVPNSEPVATYTFKAWIPLNPLPRDARVKYKVNGYSYHWTSMIDQENYADVWVSLGSEYGSGSSVISTLYLPNTCQSACMATDEVWWDEAWYSH